ncbi:MAG TPA: ABC transporter permease [Acidobacteriaceae bacterium]|jgi:predicted permease|nr:ABC transporter permease [Acidobacteriaceae bacterium]
MNLRRFFGRKAKDAELAEEIQSHLAHDEDLRRARGVDADEARRQARVKFGGRNTVRDTEWRYRSLPWVESLWRDLKFVVRSLAKTPGFTIIAILVIAVGIGVNTAVFSVINTVLLKPLIFPHQEELVDLMNTSPRGPRGGANVPKFRIWREQTSIFSKVAGFDFGGAGLNLTGGDKPQQVQGVHVTQQYFSMLGVPVIQGRTFTEAEDSPNGGRVVVLSYALWKSRFGGNAQIVGSTIQLDGQPYLVVGIIGKSFVTDTPTDLYLPFQFDLNTQDQAHYFTVAARLKPGITYAQANAQLKLAADEYRRTYGPRAMGPQDGFGVVSLAEAWVGDARESLWVLMAAVGFVLLIACANVANLMLVRASGRRRELATRAALGAGRGQIVRQLLTESLVLALTGGLLGLVLGATGVRLLLAMAPTYIPHVGENGTAVVPDMHVLMFTLGVSVLTGILFGLAPAISASRPNLVAALNESSSRSGVGFRNGKLRSALVISEMALALILVIGAALLIRTFMKLQAVDPGYDTRRVLTMAMSISGDRFQKTAGVAQLVRDGTDRLTALPGVTDAAAACCLPLDGGFGLPFNIVGRPKGDAPFTGGGGYDTVSWNYFNTFKIPLLRGRMFTEQDNGAAPGVVIINEALAKHYWPKGDPLKDRMEIAPGAGPAFAEPARQIIGIVGDTRSRSLDSPPDEMMYTPIAQMPDGMTALNSRVAPLMWIVHTRVEPHSLAAPMAEALRVASGGLPVAHIRTMEEIVVLNTSRRRFNMLLLTIFGASALLMAAIGIYGLMAYSVQQRTQEMGIRMALGAQASHIRNMVIRQGMVLALIGVVIGIAGAFGLTRFLASFLFDVKAWDPLAFVLTPLLLGAVALLAVWVPAQRAVRVDPMTALRFE